jgi:hypothetical protein
MMYRPINTDKDSVVRAGPATTLSVPEGGNSGIESQTLTEELFDVFHFDGFEVAVDRPFRNDDNSLSLSNFTVLEGSKVDV